VGGKSGGKFVDPDSGEVGVPAGQGPGEQIRLGNQQFRGGDRRALRAAAAVTGTAGSSGTTSAWQSSRSVNSSRTPTGPPSGSARHHACTASRRVNAERRAVRPVGATIACPAAASCRGLGGGLRSPVTSPARAAASKPSASAPLRGQRRRVDAVVLRLAGGQRGDFRGRAG
jgi:hypothetical protein